MSSSAPVVGIVTADTVEHITAAGVRELNEFFAQHTNDVLAVAPTEAALRRFAVPPSEIRAAVTTFPLEASEFAADWSELPPRVAVRIAPPGTAAVVVISLARLNEQATPLEPLADVSEPLWDWLILRVRDRTRTDAPRFG